jgi:hypothetical protein
LAANSLREGCDAGGIKGLVDMEGFDSGEAIFGHHPTKN